MSVQWPDALLVSKSLRTHYPIIRLNRGVPQLGMISNCMQKKGLQMRNSWSQSLLVWLLGSGASAANA
jgi:hypothetical protein